MENKQFLIREVPTLCEKINCQHSPKFEVILELRPSRLVKPALSTPILYICGEHITISFDEAVSPKGWEAICKQFEASGMNIPVRAYSNIVIRDISAPKA